MWHSIKSIKLQCNSNFNILKLNYRYIIVTLTWLRCPAAEIISPAINGLVFFSLVRVHGSVAATCVSLCQLQFLGSVAAIMGFVVLHATSASSPQQPLPTATRVLLPVPATAPAPEIMAIRAAQMQHLRPPPGSIASVIVNKAITFTPLP